METWTLPPTASARPAAPAARRLRRARAALLPAALALALSAPAAAGEKSAAPASAGSAAKSAPAAAGPSTAPAALPDFTLPDLEGKPHRSADWKGKVVLVDFWATWCAACRETIPALARLQEKYGTQGLAVVGVSTDKAAAPKVAKFARKHKMAYQVLHDAEDSLSEVFGFEGLPSLYLYDREGKLLKAMTGYTAEAKKELEALVAAQFAAGR